MEVGDRLVEETGRVVAITPYAPQWSGETWIVPREPGESLGEVDDDDLVAFADVLRDTLRRVAHAFDNPSVNVLILSAPLRAESARGFRWHVRIQPRMTTPGGFELASGMSITTLAPEAAVPPYRRTALPPYRRTALSQPEPAEHLFTLHTCHRYPFSPTCPPGDDLHR